LKDGAAWEMRQVHLTKKTFSFPEAKVCAVCKYHKNVHALDFNLELFADKDEQLQLD
jgi:hypothetical protein